MLIQCIFTLLAGVCLKQDHQLVKEKMFLPKQLLPLDVRVKFEDNSLSVCYSTMKVVVMLGSLTHPCRRDPYMQRPQGQTRCHMWNTLPRTLTWAQRHYFIIIYVQRLLAIITKKTLSHPSQDPSGLCNLRQYSRPSFKVELTEKIIPRNNLAISSCTETSPMNYWTPLSYCRFYVYTSKCVFHRISAGRCWG